MNTSTIKEISKWVMVIGACLFTAGAGTHFACSCIERGQRRTEHLSEMLDLEKADRIEKNELDKIAKTATIEREHLYSERLKSMSDKEFAKFHAEQVAKANDDVVFKANKIAAYANAELAKVKLECSKKITTVQEECLKKIEKAEALRDDAKAKYEAINSLFENKDSILAAKAALEAAIKKDKKNKSDKEELLNAIKDILE